MTTDNGDRDDLKNLGVSEFVLKYISKKAGSTGRDVLKAFAEAKGEDKQACRNTVFNTISRLKSSHRLRAEVYDGLSRYYINNESSQEAA